MGLFHVPESNPRLVDDQFVAAFPALGIVPTLNSGAYWGDGDGRPRTIDYGELQFAHESKVRFTKRGKLYPSTAELKKALVQLRRRNPQAIRLFLVYNTELDRYTMSIPWADARQLEHHGFVLNGTLTGDEEPYWLLEEQEWIDLYELLAAAR